jgi:hypothetical protein
MKNPTFLTTFHLGQFSRTKSSPLENVFAMFSSKNGKGISVLAQQDSKKEGEGGTHSVYKVK